MEETWGRIHSDVQITNIDSPRPAPQGKATWEPDPKPLMTNHPPRVTDSNTSISLSEDSLNGPCPRDDSCLGWVQIQRKFLLWKEEIEGFSIITHEGLTTLAQCPPSNRMDNYQRNVEHPWDAMGSEHGNISKDTRIMQKPITLGMS